MHSKNHTFQEVNSIKADMHSMHGVKTALLNKCLGLSVPTCTMKELGELIFVAAFASMDGPSRFS